MAWMAWAQVALTLALVFALAFPMGHYLAAIAQAEEAPGFRPIAAIERRIFATLGIDPNTGMTWKEYSYALIALNALHFLLLYAILRTQSWLPFNPEAAPNMSPQLAFNTAASFVTNTNWQAYVPESQISYGAQMFGLTVHNFLSAGTGIVAAFAVMRAFSGSRTILLGNMWADMVRVTLRLLIPVSLVCAFFLITQGVPQTLSPYAHVTTLQGAPQTIALGPVAWQEAIKIFGTNGGGFFNANSAHPFENPTALTNLVENILLLLIPFALPLAFGRLIGQPRAGRALFLAMAILLTIAVIGGVLAEQAANPALTALGLDPSMGNMEGKEVRFGAAASALFNISATGTSTGAVNSFTDSYLPLGGLIPLFLMQLGEVTPGGVGSGFYTLIVFALLAVFVAGLMVGRTPEYLGKKVQAHEIKLAMLAVLVLTLFILGGSAIALNTASGLASLGNAGPHGLSEMLYAWTSATENNGSAFAGLSADTPLLDYGLGAAMIFGRFAFLVPVMAIAGALAEKPKLPSSAGTFPVDGALFVGLLIGVIVILGGLQFLPADALGPIADHFTLHAGKTY